MRASQRAIGTVGVVGAFAVVTFGCSTLKSRTEPSTTSAAPGTTQPVSWDGKLLTVTDVGTEWTVGKPINDADRADFAKPPCEESRIDPTVAARLQATTGIQFEPTSKAYRHLIEFVLSGEPTQLGADLDSMAKAILGCSGVTATTTAGGTASGGALTVSTLDLPKIGDQSFGFVFEGKESANSTAAWHVRSALVRVGNKAIGIGLTEILNPGESLSINDAAFVALVTKAAARLG